MENNLYDITSGFLKLRTDEKRNAVVFGLTEENFNYLSEGVLDDISEYEYKIVKYNKEKYEQLYNETLYVLKDIKYLLYINNDIFENARKKYMKGA